MHLNVTDDRDFLFVGLQRDFLALTVQLITVIIGTSRFFSV